MDGGRRKLRALGGPARAVGGHGSYGAGPSRSYASSRPQRVSPQRQDHRAAPRAPQDTASRFDPHFSRLAQSRFLRPGIGWAGVAILFVCTGVYGSIIGDRWNEIGSVATAMPNAFVSGSGFAIANIDVEGRKILTDREILDALDVVPGQSLVFLDVTAARERLMQNPLVISATVRKLYPDKVAISVVEREPYALWQRGEKMSVIAQDGTVIEGAEDGRFADLPMLVGQGAQTSAKSILAAIEPYPELHKKIYAMVRVGDRRWNLRLNNGMDVKLPEHGFEKAIAQFVELDAQSRVSDRDIVEVDFRLNGRVSVRLSDEAAAAEVAARSKKKAAGT